MIIKKSIIAKLLTKKQRKHYVRVGWIFFSRLNYLEIWDETELQIRTRLYWECFTLTLLPSLLLSLLCSWWFMIIPFITYDTLYQIEKKLRSHSSFDWESVEHAGDCMYLRKRKAYAWMKLYGKKELPRSEWDY